MNGPLDLTSLALVLSAAVFFGLCINRLKQPAAIGFILAGVALGPTGLGLVTHDDSVQTLADLGVLILLFIIGMELRLQSFRALLPLAVGIAITQIAVSTGSLFAVAWFFHIQIGPAVAIGFMLAISSTALAMKMMGDVNESHAETGRLATAVLIAQDLAVVPLLLITQSLGNQHVSIPMLVVRVVLAVLLLGGFIAYLNRIKSFRFPFSEYILKDTDVGTIAIVGLCFAAAAVSGLVGLSPALGAFLIGLAIGHSTLRRAALRIAEPIQTILLFVFFLSVGLLIDLSYIYSHFSLLLWLLIAAVLGRTFFNLAILRLFGQKHAIAFRAALFLAPIGEFSFVLSDTAANAGVLNAEGHKAAIAVIALSLVTSPIWFLTAQHAHAMAMKMLTAPPPNQG